MKKSRSSLAPMAEMNLTPLIDIMLVLLIIFMLFTPIMQQGIQINLPKANAPSLPSQSQIVVLTMDWNETLSLDHHIIHRKDLHKKLKALLEHQPDTSLVIQADAKLPYGTLAHLIAEIKTIGIQQIGLATEPTP